MNVKIMCSYDGIDVVNVIDLLSILDPAMEMSYEEENESVKNWCEKKDANYYAKPKVDFFVDEAVAETKEKGKKIVLIEDLS